jgi:hypothetical protein
MTNLLTFAEALCDYVHRTYHARSGTRTFVKEHRELKDLIDAMSHSNEREFLCDLQRFILAEGSGYKLHAKKQEDKNDVRT